MHAMTRIIPILAVALALGACERAETPTPAPVAPATAPAAAPMEEPVVESDDAEDRLAAIIDGEHRPEADRARDQYRNPAATLAFFGLEPDMTVVEVWPGGGWYTDIIAPYVRDQGKYYGAHFDPEAEREFARNAAAAFREKLAGNPDLYGNAEATVLACPDKLEIAPEGSADLVVAFRSLHNWMGAGCTTEALSAIHRALKPGGTFGLVGHSSRSEEPQDPRGPRGYVREDYAIELVEAAGFELVDTSDVNANPLDPTDHERGVWTLPPMFALGDENRDEYAEIGESHRFTLKFRKPE